MKLGKKILGLLLAAMMVLSMVGTAMAEGTYSISITNTPDGHTYQAYKIFDGELEEKHEDPTDANKVTSRILSNIEWGKGISKYDGKALSETDAAAIAEQLSKGTLSLDTFISKITLSETFAGETDKKDDATGNYTIGGLDAGYYLVKDKDGSLDTTTDDAYTKFIVQVLSTVEIARKADTPKVEKKVKDKADTDGTESNWQDAADHDIGDMVDFQLTGTLPNYYDTYTKYEYKFTDTMSDGLTYQGDAKIYVVDKAGTRHEVTNQFKKTPASTQKGGTLEFSADLKSIMKDDQGQDITITSDSKIVVEYTAQLNDSALYGTQGNPNKVKLTYSNNPNAGGDGSTGETPEDTVIVFTFKTVINKVQNNPEYDATTNPDVDKTIALTGAAFKLEKKVKDATTSAESWKLVKDFTNESDIDSMSSFAFTGLDDGLYKLSETKTPAGFNSIEPLYFVIKPTHTEGNDDNPSLTKLEAFATDENGNIKKNDQGTDVTFGEITLKANASEITDPVLNLPGSTLPSTGGMGTTILYVVGGLLVVAAAVLLMTKKRVGADK